MLDQDFAIGMPAAIVIVFFCSSILFVCFRAAKPLIQEFRLIWLCEPVELLIRECKIVPLRVGYKMEIEHEFSNSGQTIISRKLSFAQSAFQLYRPSAEKINQMVGQTRKGYFDPKSNQTYLTGKHYDLIDKIFSPFFMLATPIIIVVSTRILLMGVGELLRHAIAGS